MLVSLYRIQSDQEDPCDGSGVDDLDLGILAEPQDFMTLKAHKKAKVLLINNHKPRNNWSPILANNNNDFQIKSVNSFITVNFQDFLGDWTDGRNLSPMCDSFFGSNPSSEMPQAWFNSIFYFISIENTQDDSFSSIVLFLRFVLGSVLRFAGLDPVVSWIWRPMVRLRSSIQLIKS